ncbi:GFA family protein [Aliishimia ponticola]|uniref:GFA family protein n=1 Tax=Aliishimia ponticola TaxID=2499833 RepID=A0A4S4ND18_9RHOB|nr:GFA family protein [Aliishimia ponticola]THH37364.1 GFA family protein [Aliishimia ponticola]
MSRSVTASCHCGAVRIRATLRGDHLLPSRCTCSFCRRRQAGNVSADLGSLEILSGESALRLYQFGSQTAAHYFCGTCGIYTHHKRRSDPTEIGINIGCIDGAEPWQFEPMPWNDGINHPSDASD